MARRKLIAGNWKMNMLQDDGVALARDLAERLDLADQPGFDMLICPPATLLRSIGQAMSGSGLLLGGQDCHADKSGAYTGDISAEMLRDLGVSYVIVGHSERRQFHGESDAMVNAKAKAAWRAGLTAVLCIGETLAERDAGKALDVLQRQIESSVPDGGTAQNLVLAYEPVWAIGTGRTPSVDDVAAAHRHIRTVLAKRSGEAGAIRLLYGGSVKPDNAGVLLKMDNVDGALVGGASLKAGDFWAIGAASV
ncbi:MAG: triose-phosphate isomerase [Rhodospirillales bacterium]